MEKIIEQQNLLNEKINESSGSILVLENKLKEYNKQKIEIATLIIEEIATLIIEEEKKLKTKNEEHKNLLEEKSLLNKKIRSFNNKIYELFTVQYSYCVNDTYFIVLISKQNYTIGFVAVVI